MRALLLAALLCACPNKPAETSGEKSEGSSTSSMTSTPPGERGPPLEFALDPLERDFEHEPESTVLRGKRAIVLVMQSFDVGSLMALRTLAPMLNSLPPDTMCLQVALQPVGDRPLIGPFMDAEKTPCRRAIGDPKRGRLGDLAKVKVIPTVLVLRADGTLAGGRAGQFDANDVKALLDSAK